MTVGVFIRSDKVALKGGHPLFSRVRQTFRQLPALSQASAAYLLLPLPPHHRDRTERGRGRLGSQGQWDEDALGKPLSNEGQPVLNSKAGSPDPCLLSERSFYAISQPSPAIVRPVLCPQWATSLGISFPDLSVASLRRDL